jgi:hypothetical protein
MTSTSTLSVLRICQFHHVELVVRGGKIVLQGPSQARDFVRDLVRDHKLELMAVLAAPPTPQTAPLPPDGHGEEWHRDFLGRPVNLAGLRKPQGGPQ